MRWVREGDTGEGDDGVEELRLAMQRSAVKKQRCTRATVLRPELVKSVMGMIIFLA